MCVGCFVMTPAGEARAVEDIARVCTGGMTPHTGWKDVMKVCCVGLDCVVSNAHVAPGRRTKQFSGGRTTRKTIIILNTNYNTLLVLRMLISMANYLLSIAIG
jgi:hypothetical protein